jgi:hypothetical protein
MGVAATNPTGRHGAGWHAWLHEIKYDGYRMHARLDRGAVKLLTRTNRPVLGFAHVTNQMARIEGDFEKGEADGTRSSLDVIVTAARACGFWSYRRVPGALMSGSFRDSDA